MHQPVSARQDVDERAEIHEPHHLALIHRVHFDIGGNLFDAANRFLGGGVVGRGDFYRAVVINVDVDSGFFGQRADYRPALCR